MQPERWRRVEELFHGALSVEEGRRVAFLEESCAGDPDLRIQVESLLARHKEAGSFLESPALDLAAQGTAEAERALSQSRGFAGAMAGKTVSHYRVLEKLGAGGMGVVCKAQDIKLPRVVALNSCPKLFSEVRKPWNAFGARRMPPPL